VSLVPVNSLRNELKRARIRRKDTGEEFEVQFNPESFSIMHAAEWRHSSGPTAERTPAAEYICPQPRELTLNLTFDAVENDRDIVGDVQRLASWMLPAERSQEEGHIQPPVLEVDWNTPSRFECHLESVNAAYTLFRRDGTPVRATVTVTLKELPAPLPGTNPSSGGERGHRRYVVTAAESLHSIAHREYGDPRLWRAIAAVNHVDDPLTLAPGRVLHLPPRDQVAQRN
jgi:nucleoid-associated protein YgaU